MQKKLSRPFDVHKWSDHPEVNNFVNSIYDIHFKLHKSEVLKKHLKVVLLDLYVAWQQHPSMRIGVHMSRNAYKAKSRYNELHISQKTIDVVKELNNQNFINLLTGFNPGKITRIWAANKLIKLFEKAKFKSDDIRFHKNKEVLILRDTNKMILNIPIQKN